MQEAVMRRSRAGCMILASLRRVPRLARAGASGAIACGGLDGRSVGKGREKQAAGLCCFGLGQRVQIGLDIIMEPIKIPAEDRSRNLAETVDDDRRGRAARADAVPDVVIAVSEKRQIRDPHLRHMRCDPRGGHIGPVNGDRADGDIGTVKSLGQLCQHRHFRLADMAGGGPKRDDADLPVKSREADNLPVLGRDLAIRCRDRVGKGDHTFSELAACAGRKGADPSRDKRAEKCDDEGKAA